MMTRVVSLFLALLLAFTLLPVSVFAEENEADTEETQDQVVEDRDLTMDDVSEGDEPKEPTEQIDQEVVKEQKEQTEGDESDDPSDLLSLPDPASNDDLFSDLTFVQCEGCTTEITDAEGKVYHYTGILDATSLESISMSGVIASYRVFAGSELLIEVSLHDIQTITSFYSATAPAANGYFSASFDISTTQQAYLTGLTSENLESVQAEIIQAHLNGTDASFEHIDFIDTEKVGYQWNMDDNEDSDWDMCWAAVASNLLHYTGWGANAGFGSEDYLFDVFTSRFSNSASNISSALFWFFNGVNPKQDLYYYAQVDDGTYGDFLGYYPKVPYENVIKRVNIEEQQSNLSTITGLLEENYGIGLGISFLDKLDGMRQDGHTTSLWGYVREKSDSSKISYLFVSDSDSDFDWDSSAYGNRRDSANRLQALSVDTRIINDIPYWHLGGYDSEMATAVVSEFTALSPYSADISLETEGTGNRFTSPDLTVQAVGIDSVPGSHADNQTVFPANKELFIHPIFFNASPIDAPKFTYRIELSQNGASYGSPIDGTFPYSGLDALWDTEYAIDPISIGALPEGEYCATITVNPLHSIEEANYSNNTKTIAFRVSSKLSSGTLSVSLGDMGLQDNDDIGAYASITCPLSGKYYYIYTAYGDDTAVTDWILRYEGSSFPTRLFTYRDIYYANVFYRVLVRTSASSGELCEFLSDGIAQRYNYIYPFAASNNVYNLTPRSQGSSYYYYTEQTSFNFNNCSTVDGDLSFDWRLRAYQEGDLDSYWWRLGSWGSGYGSASLSKGYIFTNPRTNTQLFTSDNKYPTPGRYYLYAEAEYKDLLGNTEVSRTWLGTIVITSNTALPQVITGDGVYADNFGAYVSLSALVDLNTNLRLGFEYSTSSSFSSSSVSWIPEDVIDYDRMNIYSGRWITDLFPGTTYYYRAVLQADGNSMYRGETKVLSTSSADTELLSLNVTKTVSLDSMLDSVSYMHNYIFRPAASGWYHISIVGGDCSLSSFAEGETDPNYDFADNRQISTDYYLKSGTRYCLSLRAFESSTYSVTVTYSDMSVNSYTANAPVLENNGDYGFIAQVSASIPRGSTFKLGIQYGPDINSLTSDSVQIENYPQDHAEASFVMSCKPDRVYLYRTFIEVADTGNTYYSDFQTIQIPPYSGEALLYGEHTLVLERNQTYYMASFTADTAGSYTIRVDGPDGLLGYWGDGWQHKQFSLNGCSYRSTLAAGESAYCKIVGYKAGTYHISYIFVPDKKEGTMRISCPGFVTRTGPVTDTETMQILRPGDINQSGGEADAIDMQRLYEYLTGSYTITDPYLLRVADINDDGQVDVYDLQLLYEVVSGISKL